MKIEQKVFKKPEIEYKIEDSNGIPVGIVEGYISTWDVDRGDGWVTDQFIKGCFKESIQDHIDKNRQVRLKDHHGRTIGGFPPEFLREDDRGLFAKGEVNLEVQQGKEIYMLAKQGVITDFSIGFTSLEDFESDGIRQITKAIIWEGSMVDEPMNPEANIISVKEAVPFVDLPLASEDREWDSEESDRRVRNFTDSIDEPSERYKDAFLWYDRSNELEFGAYKLPIADVVDGELKAVPRAIFAAAAAMNGARGGVDIPDDDRQGVINSIDKYYDKMGRESPFEEQSISEDDEDKITSDDIKDMTKRDLEKSLQEGKSFTRKSSKIVASFFRHEDDDSLNVKMIINKLSDITKYIKSFKKT